MARARMSKRWVLMATLVAAALSGSARGVSAQSPSAASSPSSASVAAVESLVWASERPRLRDDERWLDLLDAPAGVLAIGRDSAGPTLARRNAAGGWRTMPFPPFGDIGTVGPTDGPTRLVLVDDHALAVGTVDGRLATWSPGPSGSWRRAADRPAMALLGLSPEVTPGMATVGWVASDGDRVVATGSAGCSGCPSTTWMSEDGTRWERARVLVDGQELVGVFSGRDRVLGVTVQQLPDGTAAGTLVASPGGEPWSAVAALPIPWKEAVQVAETSEALVVIGPDDAGRLGAWMAPRDGGAWVSAWSEPSDDALEVVVRDVATLGSSVLAVGAIESGAASAGWTLWSPDGLDWSVTASDPGAGCPTSAVLTSSDALAVDGGCDGSQLAWRAVLPGPVRCDGLTPTIEADAGGGTITGTAGDDVILGSAAEDRIDGGAGNDVICGGGEHDVLIGGPGDDVLLGEAGTDEVIPGPGDDLVDGGPSRYDTLSYRDTTRGIRADMASGRVTGEGIDTVRNVEYLTGTMWPDRIIAGPNTASVEGLAGDDVLIGSAGSDRLQGGGGRDRIDGGPGRDEVDGGAGKDLLRGGPGDDILVGGVSVDVVRGGAGDDLLFGATPHDCGSGDCRFPYLVLADLLDGGPGRDTCLDGRRFACEIDR